MQARQLIQHFNATVRRKALLALHSIHLCSPGTPSNFFGSLEKALCDTEPGVLAAGVAVVKDLLCQNPVESKKMLAPLLSVFVTMLKQIVHHRLSRDYDFHHTPAPWLQMHLMEILSTLGKDDKQLSLEVYDVISDTLRRAEASATNIGYALVFQATMVICRIYPNRDLISMATNTIAMFLSSPNNNLRHCGIIALEKVARIDPEVVLAHQLAIVDCLEDSDQTLKRKTLDLLVEITTVDNVEVVVEKLLGQLRVAPDTYWKRDLIRKVSRVAERYATSPIMFVDTLLQTVQLGGDLVTFDNLLVSFVCEGPGEGLDDAFHQQVVETALGFTSTSERIPDKLAETCLWILGEYGIQSSHRQTVIRTVLEFATSDSPRVLLATVEALSKWTDPDVTQRMVGEPNVVAMFARCKTSCDLLLRQRAAELHQFMALPTSVRIAVRPFDGYCDEVQVQDPAFNDLVESCLLAGAAPYSPPTEVMPQCENVESIKFQPYEKQTAPVAPMTVPVAPRQPAPAEPPTEVKLQARSCVWGPGEQQRGASIENFQAPSMAPRPSAVATPLASELADQQQQMTDKQQKAAKLFGTRRKSVDEPSVDTIAAPEALEPPQKSVDIL